MKRFAFFGILLGTLLFISAQSAMAFGIDICATVNPNWNNCWDKTKLEGIALSTIGIDPVSQFGANVLSVTLEDDIFASIGNATNGTAGLLSPDGWSLNYYENPNGGFNYEIAFGPLLSNESPFVPFWIDYILHSDDRYNQGSGIGWAYNEGCPWQQAVSAKNTEETLDFWLGGGNPSGDTSTVANPKPATMVLLGSGLIGLGWIGRKRTKNETKNDSRA